MNMNSFESNDMNATDRDEKLINLHAQLSAAMIERGIAYARQDDPNSYSLAERLLTETPGARLELRTVIPTGDEAISTYAVVIDADGELLAEVFKIVARHARGH